MELCQAQFNDYYKYVGIRSELMKVYEADGLVLRERLFSATVFS
jgi:hypothetical protein